jgi:S-DNA-T family DNA segregation ATPase FtsK/SpoIIIE
VERMVLRSPPVLERPDAGGGLLGTLPVLGSLGSIGLVATMVGGPRQYAGIALFVGATVLVALAQLERQRRQRARAADVARRGYLDHLAEVRDAVRAAAAVQRATALARHPPPHALPALVECRAWRAGDGSSVRYGVAELPWQGAPEPPEIVLGADPFCVEAARRLVTAHATCPELPATVALAGTGELTAPPGTARALVCAAVGCAEVGIAVLAAPESLGRWEWVKWLRQTGSPCGADGAGPRRLVAGSMGALRPLLPQRGHLLLVVDGVLPPALDRPATVLRVGDRLTADGRALPGTPDDCPVEVAEAFARRCAAVGGGPFAPVPDWAPRRPEDRLRVPVGVSESGDEVLLDLKESALGGAGPHGAVIGATGSGKSELLRALVLRLALAHPPSELNLVLVDFKGGTAFDGLAALPHVSALITNLADELDLLDRTADALAGELTRRQQVLRTAGGDRSGLPTLLVVVDEFAELLAARPELDELFVSLGRLGRGLGIHLLLASQRLDEGRWRGLESHLSYRICLRTFTPEESRAVLGTVAAYELGTVPGLGYLRTDPRTLIRFRAPYVGSVVRPAPDPRRVLPFTAAPVSGPAPLTMPLVDAAVAAMRGRGRAHPIWLPPLDRPATLGDLLPALGVAEGRGFGQRSPTVPLGEVDRPRWQRRDRLEVDLTAGHVAVVGAPGSGRSTLLCTAVAGLALTRTPEEVTVHLLDLGGALAPLARLPHVGGIAGRGQPELAALIVGGLARADRTERPAVLVVDDWAVLRQELPDLEEELTRVALRGRALGVHLLVATGRWADLRAPVRDGFDVRIELRLGDPLDSEVDRRLAATVPRGRPGRGIVEGAHFLAALPRLGGTDEADEGLVELVDRVARHWPGAVPRRVQPLPALVLLEELPPAETIRLGLGSGDPDVRTLPDSGHLLVLGDGGSGRTGLLRTILREVVRTRPDDRIVVVDPRGTLAEERGATQVLAHLTDDPTSALTELAAGLAPRLRVPAPRAPDVWVIVDDLDLLASTPWQPLLPMLARTADLGLRLVVARRAGGAARAFYEPLLAALRDLRSPGVLLSGTAEEGPLLHGVPARPAPPGRARWVGPPDEEGAFQVAWSDAPTLERSNC